MDAEQHGGGVDHRDHEPETGHGPEDGAQQADDARLHQRHAGQATRRHSYRRQQTELAPALHADQQQRAEHGDEGDHE